MIVCAPDRILLALRKPLRDDISRDLALGLVEVEPVLVACHLVERAKREEKTRRLVVWALCIL